MATSEASKKEDEADDDATADTAFTAADGIRKLQEGKAGEYGLYLDPDAGYEMVRIVKEEEGAAHVRLANDTALVVSAKQITRLDPAIAHFVRREQAKDPFDSTTELANLRFQLSPPAKFARKRYCCRAIFDGLCCRPPKDDMKSARFRRNIRRSLNFLDLSPSRKAIVLDRYVSLVETYNHIKKRYTVAYNFTRSIVTLLHVLTPGFVSIQPYFGADTYSNAMYWVTFATTVVSGLITSYISLFKLDKKFYSTTHAYLRLESEGWAYITLTGKYGRDPDTGVAPTHDSRFHQFCNEVEQIRQSEMKVDMIKTGTAASGSNGSQDGTTRRR
jgi:hypothetical protein